MSTAGHYGRALVQRGLRASSTRNVGIRAFATNTSYQTPSTLPAFTETSNPALDDILYAVKSKYIIPAHLRKAQKQLVTKQKNRTRLENEEVYATIGDEDVRLEPLDTVRRPAKRKLFGQAIELAKEPEDWENVLKMMGGLHQAREVMNRSQMAKFVRRANAAGMQHVVLLGLRQVRTSGLSLKHPEVLEAVMEGAHRIGQDGDWGKTETTKALRYGEQLLGLMEEPSHHVKEIKGNLNPMFDASIVGLTLEAAAVLSHQHQGSDADLGKVKRYADRVLTLWDQTSRAQVRKSKTSTRFEAEAFILKWVPVWHGLTIAQKVLGSNMPKGGVAQEAVALLEDRINAAANVVRAALPAEEARKTRGLIAWQKVIR